MGVQGNTDSEWAFALFLDSLQKLGCDPDDESYAINGFGHANLRNAMLQTIKRINAFVDAAAPSAGGETTDKRSLLNFAVADGHSVVCTRYVSSVTDEAASLYFSSGTSWKEGKVGGGFRMERRDRGRDIVLVASEPLTFERGASLHFPLPFHLYIHPTPPSPFPPNPPQTSSPTNHSPLHPNRQLGHRPHQQHYHNPQTTNRHDPPYRRRIL